jgi:hypothetical protein
MMPGNGINYEKCNSSKKIVKKKFFFVFFYLECCKHKLIKKTMKNSNKLEAICNKYCTIQHNYENYYIGGGLTDGKFASNRHEDAKYDAGKLTLGEATQLFKKATGLETDLVREILEYAVPNMEWHHAGKLPKSYGGGMKKTYFLNSDEICECAKNWDSYYEKLSLSKIAAKNAAEEKNNLEKRKLEFLQANAEKIERTTNVPTFFYKTAQEMNGKYGWFDSTYKSYNMTEYYSGWKFESQEKYNEFINLK